MVKRKQWRCKWREVWIKREGTMKIMQREGRKMTFFVWNNCTDTERCFCLCEGRWITSSSTDSFLLKTTWHVESGVFFWSFVSLRVSPLCLVSQYFSHVCTSVCSSRWSSWASQRDTSDCPRSITSSCSTRAPMYLGEVKPSHGTDKRKDTHAGGCCLKFWTEKMMGVRVNRGMDRQTERA